MKNKKKELCEKRIVVIPGTKCFNFDISCHLLSIDKQKKWNNVYVEKYEMK